MTALFVVTGGSGFIGSHLTERLLRDHPQARVRILDDFSTGRAENLSFAAAAGDRLEIVRGDIRDLATVERVAAGARTIVHQAGMRSVPRSGRLATPTPAATCRRVLQPHAERGPPFGVKADRIRPLSPRPEGPQSRRVAVSSVTVRPARRPLASKPASGRHAGRSPSTTDQRPWWASCARACSA